MNIEELKTILNNKLTTLNNRKSAAVAIGDLYEVEKIEEEIIDVESILNKLNS